MRRLLAKLEAWFPSTPPALRGRAAAAASIEPTCSRSQDRPGKAVLGAGHQTPAPVVHPTTPAAGAGQTPEGEGCSRDRLGGRRGSELVTTSPSGPPSCETDLFWEPAPDVAYDFAPGRLSALLTRWKGQS